jgi:predicted transcriptional regulator
MAMPDSIGSTSVSLRVPKDLLQQLDAIAAALDRPRSWILLRALRQYLRDEGAEILEVKEGMAQLDNGEGRRFDEALGDLQDTIAKAEAKPNVG